MRFISITFLLLVSFHNAHSWDWLPIISQIKSLVVQVISGDAAGARRTQENFSRSTLGLLRAPIELSMGKRGKAKRL